MLTIAIAKTPRESVTRRILVIPLLFVLACLSSCDRSSPSRSVGSTSTKIADNAWAYCFEHGDEIPYVLFFRETGSPTGLPVVSGGSGSSNGIVHSRAEVHLPGKKFAVKYTSKSPDILRIDGIEHRLSEGRVFLCSMENGSLVIQQLNVPVQRSRDATAEILRLAAEEPVRRFFAPANAATQTRPS